MFFIFGAGTLSMETVNKMLRNLVADIGGTNIRLGLVNEQNEVDDVEVFACAEFSSLADVISHYIAQKSLTDCLLNACLAIACPVEQDNIVMTNLPWQFSQTELKTQLGLNKLLLINDYTAIAFSMPLLTDKQKVKVGGGQSKANKPIAICGPGTGLGVAGLIPHASGWSDIDGEGGHTDFAPVDQTEIEILSYLLTKYQHVSYEQLLSGLGIEQIYQALNHIQSKDLPPRSAQEISELALANSCELCQQTLNQFCKVLGSFAGNLALTLGSFGGVYIAGGIVPRFLEFFQQSDFRTRFEEKGRMSALNQEIATFVITESQPGLLGAAAYLCQHNKGDS